MAPSQSQKGSRPTQRDTQLKCIANPKNSKPGRLKCYKNTRLVANETNDSIGGRLRIKKICQVLSLECLYWRTTNNVELSRVDTPIGRPYRSIHLINRLYFQFGTRLV